MSGPRPWLASGNRAACWRLPGGKAQRMGKLGWFRRNFLSRVVRGRGLLPPSASTRLENYLLSSGGLYSQWRTKRQSAFFLRSTGVFVFQYVGLLRGTLQSLRNDHLAFLANHWDHPACPDVACRGSTQ